MIQLITMKKENDLSFTKIYQEYYRRIFNYAFSRLLHREEAEDATAEVFLVLLQNLRSFDPKRGSVGTWINRIAHNAVDNYCRKAYRRKEFPSSVLIREKEEAGAYMAELADVELDSDMLKKVAGGVCWENCPSEGSCGHHVCGLVGWQNFKGC